MVKRVDEEDRRLYKLRRFGTENPRCVGCNESDVAVLERHHLAGEKCSEDLVTVCRNCHRKLSLKQCSHGTHKSRNAPNQMESMGHYLLGLADLLTMVAEALRNYGNQLIGESK